MDGEELGFCMVHSGASHGPAHHKKWFLEPRKGKPEKTTTPKRDRNHSHRCTYTHAKTHPHNRLHTKCAFWIKCWGGEYSSMTFHWDWKDTNRQGFVLFFLFFSSFLFLSSAFSGQHVIGLEVQRVMLPSVVLWRRQWRVVVWGTQRNTQKEIKDTEVLHRDSVRHLFSRPPGPCRWHFQVQNAGLLRCETACWRLRLALLCGISLRGAKGEDPSAWRWSSAHQPAEAPDAEGGF